MGVISSWKKSSKLRKLQKAIHPPGADIRNLVSSLRNSIKSSSDPKKEALNEYLIFCSEDKGIKSVMEMYDLSIDDLHKIYTQLLANNFGWVKGHHTALSNIAYVEPPQHYVESDRRAENKLDVLTNLYMYWRNEIPQGELLRSL